MLHPLRPDQRRVEKPSEGTPADQKNRHIMTLHFDFGQLPSEADLTTLGRDFNEIFERNTLGVDRVRWGGIRRTAFGFAARKWRRSLRNRRASSKGGTVGHLKHKGPRPLPAMPSIDTGFLSPQAAAFTSQDSVETESPQSLIPSSAPTSDMEKESEGSATVTGSIQDAFEKLRKARKDNKKSMP